MKEFVEANLTYALVRDLPLPTPEELGTEGNTWLNGLAEAATELRRRILDIIRHGHSDEAERLLDVMDQIYSQLVTFDFNDSITGGLRRRTDTVRAVLERTRGDVTNSLRQAQLEEALEECGKSVERIKIYAKAQRKKEKQRKTPLHFHIFALFASENHSLPAQISPNPRPTSSQTAVHNGSTPHTQAISAWVNSGPWACRPVLTAMKTKVSKPLPAPSKATRNGRYQHPNAAPHRLATQPALPAMPQQQNGRCRAHNHHLHQRPFETDPDGRINQPQPK
ncbi:MAG: hypothetical protein H6656_02595 [Ardenticatenaceae bacterium]|nr:hypothetical protein [Ardenticatenaceae bacterium]